MGKSSEVSVVGTIVEGQSRVDLAHIDLILTVMLRTNHSVPPIISCVHSKNLISLGHVLCELECNALFVNRVISYKYNIMYKLPTEM